MCCFSKPVRVSGTEIFARRAGPSSQYLVYSMKVTAKDDLAMILPIPVPAKTRESGVKFIDMSRYPEFFSDLSRGFKSDFDAPKAAGAKRTGDKGKSPLEVVDVGSFQASFVPTAFDLDRLAPQFRLSKKVWKTLPAYETYGFAVFKLKAKHQAFHPMAFEFPTTYRSELFFPTVHVHDGKLHDEATFDHALYCQLEKIHSPGMERWEESAVPVGMMMDYTRGAPVIERFTHVHRLKVRGKQKNRDVVVG